MFYWAEVRNFKDDPTQSGRVQIRVYNQHNDENEVKDEDLPWAVPLQSTDQPSTGKVGTNPSGLIKGSRVLVAFAENDKAKQYPIILGSSYRGDWDKKEGLHEQSDEHSGGKVENPGFDVPGSDKVVSA